jgi:hypothetical protein
VELGQRWQWDGVGSPGAQGLLGQMRMRSRHDRQAKPAGNRSGNRSDHAVDSLIQQPISISLPL